MCSEQPLAARYHFALVLICSWSLWQFGAVRTLAADPDQATTSLYGLEHREPWTSSRLQGFPEPPPPFRLQPAFPQLHIPKLIALNRIPQSPWLLAIDHQRDYGGPSRILQFVDEPAAEQTSVLLELPEIVYGLAFDPHFQENGWLYIGCNGQSPALDAVATKVLRYRVTGDGPFTCHPESRTLIVEWKSNGHNGGDLAFDNDGLLFVTAGDGTSDSDVDRQGQNIGTLNGSLLRIDVREADGETPYRIPADNPFVDTPGARGEIWAYGLRNPWRLTYDPTANQLWVGNNGQDLWESIYLIERGANYGWSIRESNHPFHTEQDPGPAPISPATYEHHHSEARSLTGGHVYRGARFPELTGAYVYGDYATGNVWAIRHDGRQITRQWQLARSSAQITGFGIDSHGELLVADHAGTILQLVPNPAESSTTFPTRLSETGLFADVASEQVAAGVIPYSVNSPLWSDGAIKQRWLAVPGMDTIQFKPRGAWSFPNGSVLVKSFAFPEPATQTMRRIETRLLVKQDQEWYGYSYRWNAEQTDAMLVPAVGQDELLDWVAAEDGVATLNWHYPSRSECMVCHSRAAEFVLGVSTEQMNRLQTYHTSQRPPVTAHQLVTLAHLGLLGLPDESALPPDLPQLADPADATQSLEQRARAYLHANCANCHVNAGGGNSKLVLDFSTPLPQTQLIGSAPLHGAVGLTEPASSLPGVVTPGEPQRSILLSRISRRGPGQMPPLATERVDPLAVQLLRDWIESLPTTP